MVEDPGHECQSALISLHRGAEADIVLEIGLLGAPGFDLTAPMIPGERGSGQGLQHWSLQGHRRPVVDQVRGAEADRLALKGVAIHETPRLNALLDQRRRVDLQKTIR